MRRRRSVTASSATASTAISATIVAALLVTTSPAVAATWTVMPSQGVGTDSSFHDVAAVSATDGWAAPPAAAAH